MISRKILFKLIATTASVCLAQTQSPSHVSVMPRASGQGYGRIDALQKTIDDLASAMLVPVISGSWEEQVLRAAERVAATSLRPNLRELGAAGLQTLPTLQGDVLVAKWYGTDPGRPEKAIWLWDTPSDTTFIFEVNPAVLLRSEFTRYCEDLFVWDERRIINSLKLTYLDPDRGRQGIIGLADFQKSQTGSNHVFFTALSYLNSAYVIVEMSKASFSTEYPPEALRVRERFPPLRLRVASLSRQSLFDELGNGYDGHDSVTDPRNRDEIIIGELLSRGPLSDDDLRHIVVGRFDQGDVSSGLVINSRMGAFLDAVGAGNKLAEYAPALERTLPGLPVRKAQQDYVVGEVFGHMQRHHIDFSHAAVGFIERDQFTSMSLGYLNMNARDEETLRRLSAISVRPEFESARNSAVENVRLRVRALRNAPDQSALQTPQTGK